MDMVRDNPGNELSMLKQISSLRGIPASNRQTNQHLKNYYVSKAGTLRLKRLR